LRDFRLAASKISRCDAGLGVVALPPARARRWAAAVVLTSTDQLRIST
jgi:hypothetical protein